MKELGIGVFAITGIIGFFMSLSIMAQEWGLVGTIFTLLLAPVTFVAVPWYAGFGQENWLPLLLNYGGALLAGLLMSSRYRQDNV